MDVHWSSYLFKPDPYTAKTGSGNTRTMLITIFAIKEWRVIDNRLQHIDLNETQSFSFLFYHCYHFHGCHFFKLFYAERKSIHI